VRYGLPRPKATFYIISSQIISEALDLPLFRKEITGKPERIEMPYVIDPKDEVEDLYALLKTVKEKYPDVKGATAYSYVFASRHRHDI
jgi:diphthamide synthase (EF-2-diphthine--ammonia ligase)